MAQNMCCRTSTAEPERFQTFDVAEIKAQGTCLAIPPLGTHVDRTEPRIVREKLDVRSDGRDGRSCPLRCRVCHMAGVLSMRVTFNSCSKCESELSNRATAVDHLTDIVHTAAASMQPQHEERRRTAVLDLSQVVATPLAHAHTPAAATSHDQALPVYQTLSGFNTTRKLLQTETEHLTTRWRRIVTRSKKASHEHGPSRPCSSGTSFWSDPSQAGLTLQEAQQHRVWTANSKEQRDTKGGHSISYLRHRRSVGRRHRMTTREHSRDLLETHTEKNLYICTHTTHLWPIRKTPNDGGKRQSPTVHWPQTNSRRF